MDRVFDKINIFISLLEVRDEIELRDSIEKVHKNQTIEMTIEE